MWLFAVTELTRKGTVFSNDALGLEIEVTKMALPSDKFFICKRIPAMYNKVALGNYQSPSTHWRGAMAKWLEHSPLVLMVPLPNTACAQDFSKKALCSPSKKWVPGSVQSWGR